MKQIKIRVNYLKNLFNFIVAALYGAALCQAQAPETTIAGIKYIRTGDGTCRASMVKTDNPLSNYTVKSTVTIDGEECTVTSISDMGINAVLDNDGSAYEHYSIKYKISFPEFVDTICSYCFKGPEKISYHFTRWKDFSFPNARVIESYAFANCVGDIIIPEGVEEIGYKINGDYQFGPTIISLPSTLKRMSALAVSHTDLTAAPTFWSTTPPVIIPLPDGNSFPLNFENNLYACIYVLPASLDVYKNAVGWCNVPYIEPISGLDAIDKVATGEDIAFEVSDSTIKAMNCSQPVEVYTNDGRCVAVGTDGTVSGINAGLYIVRCGATVSKVYVR